MRNRPICSAACGLAVTFIVVSGTSLATASAAEPKADAAEATAAMERAKRQAANPLRVILEASKVRRKVTADVETATAPTPAVAVANTNLGAAVSTSPTALVPPVPVFRTLAATGGAGSVEGRLSAPVGPVAVLQASDRVSPQVTTMPVLATPAPTLSDNGNPRLLEMVEPAIPQRVLDEIGRMVEVVADLTIRADGTVAAVNVLQPAPRQMIRYVVEAIEQWRFAVLPAERVHRVQLVFNER